MRTPVASTTRRAAEVTSGPIPSPGMSAILYVELIDFRRTLHDELKSRLHLAAH
jgi:hypothetical protein